MMPQARARLGAPLGSWMPLRALLHEGDRGFLSFDSNKLESPVRVRSALKESGAVSHD